jgi:predicted nucleic acid-binding Zn ribbon protein
MIQPGPTKTCMECGDRIAGRADKKFCSDHCRTAFNNRLNSDQSNYVRNINNILRKNRRILADLNPKGNVRIAIARLREAGFQFGYFTSLQETGEGSTFRYCYDQGYLPLEDDTLLLVVREGS